MILIIKQYDEFILLLNKYKQADNLVDVVGNVYSYTSNSIKY